MRSLPFIVLDTKLYPFITVASFCKMRTTLPVISKTLPVSAPITVHTPINDECPRCFPGTITTLTKRLSGDEEFSSTAANFHAFFSDFLHNT
ncbi:hypothetical protein TNCV_1594551 [Trichonephila clavipes]|nr:hypothetical protein TNCV_1594551 [Trichonephila clavipes]